MPDRYHQTMADSRPKLVACSQRLDEPVRNCDVARDMEGVNKKVSSSVISLV